MWTIIYLMNIIIYFLGNSSVLCVAQNILQIQAFNWPPHQISFIRFDSNTHTNAHIWYKYALHIAYDALRAVDAHFKQKTYGPWTGFVILNFLTRFGCTILKLTRKKNRPRVVGRICALITYSVNIHTFDHTTVYSVQLP